MESRIADASASVAGLAIGAAWTGEPAAGTQPEIRGYAALADKSVSDVLSEHGGQGFGTFKLALGELLVETLRPITERFTGLLDDRGALDAILAKGAARAREIAGPTLDKTYQALGLLRS